MSPQNIKSNLSQEDDEIEISMITSPSQKNTKNVQVSNKRAWVQSEDIKLVQMVTENGPQNWDFLATFSDKRSGKQIRERWQNHLNPSLIKV